MAINAPHSPSQGSQNNLDTYSDYYDKPSWWFKLRYDTQIKRKTILHLLQQASIPLKGMRVLDIGFGSGDVLLSFDPSCSIYGVEISPSALKRVEQAARRKGYRAFGFQKVEGGNLGYPAAFFDLVVASHVIEHVENDRALLDEVLRVLRPGGAALFLIPINENYPDPKHLRGYTSDSFCQEIVSAGFASIPVRLENELLFHLVEKFYYEEKYIRRKWLKALITLCFNIPTAGLPFRAYRWIDRLYQSKGYRPRQFGCVALKALEK